MKEGDIFLTNDPWKGTGHLHDFTFVTPTFRRGKMVALFASTCHVVDIGGRGMGADARQVYEEGLYIPLMHFARAGKVDETLTDIVARQCARADPGGGRSLLAGDLQRDRLPPADRDDGRVRHRRSQPAGPSTSSTSPSRPRSTLIRKIKPGEYKFSMRVDGYDKPIDLVATMKIGDSGIDVDFAGTSGVSALRHQRAGLLHRGLCLVRREVHRGAQGAEQRGLAVGDPRHRAGGFDPQRPQARARGGAPRHRPDAARRDVRLPAPGAGRRRAGRGRLVPVEPVGDGRPRPRRRRSGGDRRTPCRSPS